MEEFWTGHLDCVWHFGGSLAAQGVQPLDRECKDTNAMRDVISLGSRSIDISEWIIVL